MSSACRRIAALLLVLGAGCSRRAPAPPFREVRAILDRHCLSCHSEHNTSTVFPLAPIGVKLDELAEIQRHAPRIRVRVLDRTMPLLNKTEMTDAERELVDRWVSAGAPGP